MTPLLTFAPDADPMKPGVITDCLDIVPSTDGVSAAPPWIDYTLTTGSTAAAASTAVAATALYDSLGSVATSHIFSGTGTKIFRYSSISSAADVSRAGGYTLGSFESWSFEQFGSSALAATPSAKIQFATAMSSSSFADISTAPQAAVIKAAAGFVVAFNVDGVGDAWKCSAIYDATDWTLSVATQCVTGRLIDTPGKIVEAQRIGNDLVAFKRTATYVGRYVGAPVVWQWTRVSESIGCMDQGGSCATPYGIVFIGVDNFYIFDGTTPRPIGDGTVREWLFVGRKDNSLSEIGLTDAPFYSPILVWDEHMALVWIHYHRETDSDYRTGMLCYSPKNGRWGWGTKSGIMCITPSFTATDRSVAAIKTNGQLSIRSYANYTSGAQSAGDASFTTGLFGSDSMHSNCRNVRVRYSKIMANPVASCQGYIVDQSGAAVTAGASSTSLADGRHNMRQTARWHQFKFSYTGTAFEATGVEPELTPAGTR